MRRNLFLLLLAFLPVSAACADGVSFPCCLMAPRRLEIRISRHGLIWSAGEELRGPCKDVAVERWTRKPAGSLDLLVNAEGPTGSGRFWNVTIGVAGRNEQKPVRGICLLTTTLGWRTLRQYKNAPLPWLEDVDGDGKAELIIWDSFPLRDEASQAEFGLVAWVYRLASEDSLAIDWVLSRRKAHEIAEAYRSRLETETPYLEALRADAAAALEQFAKEECTIRIQGAR